MNGQAFRKGIANEKDGVNIHKNKAKTLDRSNVEKQVCEKEFEVKLHFSEQKIDNGERVDQELIQVLKGIYIKAYLEERRKKER